MLIVQLSTAIAEKQRNTSFYKSTDESPFLFPFSHFPLVSFLVTIPCTSLVLLVQFLSASAFRVLLLLVFDVPCTPFLVFPVKKNSIKSIILFPFFKSINYTITALILRTTNRL